MDLLNKAIEMDEYSFEAKALLISINGTTSHTVARATRSKKSKRLILFSNEGSVDLNNLCKVLMNINVKPVEHKKLYPDLSKILLGFMKDNKLECFSFDL